MAFFSRPRISDEQFVQHHDDIISLSGQTQIATTSGLTLATGDTNTIGVIVTASGASSATNNYVLTYDDSDKIIKLKESSASGGTGKYPYNESATTTVGGLVATTNLYDVPVVDILQEILVPTLSPSITNYSNSLSLNPTTSLFEVGSSISVVATSCYSRGCVDPQYCGTSEYFTGLPHAHVYCAFGNFSTPTTACTTHLSTGVTFNTTITAGSNLIYSCVAFSSGVTDIYDSSGDCICAAESAGSTTNKSKTITGTYPWYWGIESSGGAASGVNRPTSDCVKSIITGGTYSCKCVGHSNNTLYVNFGSTSDDYIWFAVPNASATKTKWYETALNNGSIGGVVSAGGNLFPDNDTEIDVCSSSPDWDSETYKIYISNYQTAASTIMELRNS